MGIKIMRESKNMTQSEVAEAVGVSRATVSMWEIGESYPRVEILIKLAELFSCTTDELIYNRDLHNER